MRYLPIAARLLLGLLFLVTGLDGFLHFLPQPSGPVPEGAAAFGGAMMKTGYMFQLVKATETVSGALLLANLFVPLALVLLAPVVVNIIAFHALLFPAGIGPGAVALALLLYLAWSYREAYRPILKMRAVPPER